MLYVRSKNYLRSRNTLIMFVILFLAFIISFKVILHFVVDSVIIFTGTIIETGNIDPSQFEMRWDSFDFSKLNPMMWKIEELKLSINGKLHDLVDIIAPALINLFSMVIAESFLFKRSVAINPMLLYDYSYTTLL